jgi:hypothetical protein
MTKAEKFKVLVEQQGYGSPVNISEPFRRLLNQNEEMTDSQSEAAPCSAAALREDAKKNQ